MQLSRRSCLPTEASGVGRVLARRSRTAAVLEPVHDVSDASSKQKSEVSPLLHSKHANGYGSIHL
jgi:hypothetical protein